MSPANLGLVALASLLFVAASACAKLHALAPAWPRLLAALALYTAGALLQDWVGACRLCRRPPSLRRGDRTAG